MNMTHDGETDSSPKQLRKLQVVDGRINFSCLKDRCPSSCCGPFGGVQRGIDSVEGRKFSEIVLTEEDSHKMMQAGYSHLMERTGTGQYRMYLLEDGTCSALKDGLCSIHHVKPTICRAFPFYVDMFVGLCGVTECPGFGSGWTKVEKLEEEVEAAREMYLFWLAKLSLPNNHCE